MAAVRHSTLKVGPVTVFYREAGLEGNPVLLLLHGFANSSHYFRHLMPLLANRFHLIAPDLPSFGFTRVDGESYRYNFAQLTETTQAFVDTLAVRRFAMYVFDYGAPIGFNLAVADVCSHHGQSYVLQDRELISSQNPCSDEALLKLLLPALNGKKK